MANPLLDVREWVLALASGLAGAAIYSYLQTQLRLRRWRRMRVSRLEALNGELMWILIHAERAHWRPASDVSTVRGLFASHALEVERIAALEKRPGAGIEPALLTPDQSIVVGTHLPSMQALIPSVVDLLRTLVNEFRDAWSTDDLEHFVEAWIALKAFAGKDFVSTFPPGTAAMEVSDAVALGHRALISLNWLSITVQDHLGGQTIHELKRKLGVM